MKGSISTDTDIERMSAAADWLVRLHDAPDDETVVSAWLQWCEDDPRNLDEFKSIQSVWHAARAVEMNDAGPTAVAAVLPARRTSWRASMATRSFMALAASILVIVGIASVVFTLRTRHEFSQSYATSVGGIGSSELPDGSRVELGAGTRITTRYTAKLRTVSVDAGEAYFSIAKDSQRPFVVTAGSMRVVAVGTAFNVRRDDSRVVVAVSEGRVQFDSAPAGTASSDNSMRLLAGEQAVYSSASGDVTIAKIRTADIASWRRGTLKYVHEPLGSVVADLSRYYPKRIVIQDAALGDLPFTGTVFSANIDGALRALEDVFPLQILERDDAIELVPRRPQSAP